MTSISNGILNKEPPRAEPHAWWCERSENESRKKTASFSSYSIVRGLACPFPSCGWLSAAEPAKEGYVGLEVDILCLEVGVGIRFTARIRSGGAVYKRSQMPRITAPETEIL